ncbi:MAG: T9SS type A sorting domain-containing protein [Bacteroidia bacterium]|nr:T9SS type A sorting domain-containing protein [Bacteroidia bacterium]
MRTIYKLTFILTVLITTSDIRAQKVLWGASTNRIFSYDIDNDSITSLATINTPLPTSLTKGPNGKLYGLTMTGGANNRGFIYKFDPSTNTVIPLYDFSVNSGYGTNYGSMVFAYDSFLLGQTFQGARTFFKFNVYTNTYTIIASSLQDMRYQRPFLASDGHLYTTIISGGNNGLGMIMRYNKNLNTYTAVHHFNSNDGKLPNNGLMQASNGKLYGMTTEGGSANNGVIYRYDISNQTFTLLYSFSGTGTPLKPYGTLVETSPGILHGIADGGASNNGCIFSYNINTNTVTLKASFVSATHGYAPRGSLIKASNGKLYFNTFVGGPLGKGCLLEFDIATNKLTTKQAYNSTIGDVGALEFIETCSLPKPFASTLPDTSFLCEYNFVDTLKASSCYGIIKATTPTQFPLRNFGQNFIEWTYDDGNGNFTKQSHFITIKALDSTIRYENGKYWSNQENVSYQWIEVDNGNKPIVGATSQSFAPQDTANYAVILTYKSCSVTSKTVNLNTVSTDNIYQNNPLIVYPNPNSGVFKVVAKNSINSITIFDLVQVKIDTINTNNQSDYTLDISHLNNGTYLLQIQTENGTFYQRVIKQ